MRRSARSDECVHFCAQALRIDGVIDAHLHGEQTVAKAVRTVLAGGTHYRTPGPALDDHAPRVFQRLTSREVEVFTMIGAGSDDPEAAARLGLSDSERRRADHSSRGRSAGPHMRTASCEDRTAVSI